MNTIYFFASLINLISSELLLIAGRNGGNSFSDKFFLLIVSPASDGDKND